MHAIETFARPVVKLPATHAWEPVCRRVPLTPTVAQDYPEDVKLPERLGRYNILSLLGAGGMGRVYLGKHQDTGWIRAIKTLRLEEGESESSKRFVREARATAEIQHENVVRVHEFSYDDDEGYYFVMEHLEGEDLQARLEQHGRLKWSELRDISLQITRGMGSAHALGIFHRDIKPSNLFLAQANGRETLKIIDFGIAKIGGGIATATSGLTAHVVGTPYYVCPEQIQLTAVDARSDIYSLGATFYHLLVGEPPFQGLIHELLQAHLDRRPVPPRKAAPDADIPEAVEAIILKCLEKRPEERYQTTLELEAALSRIADPDATIPRLTTPVTKPKRIPWLLSAGVAALIVTVTSALWYYRVSTDGAPTSVPTKSNLADSELHAPTDHPKPTPSPTPPSEEPAPPPVPAAPEPTVQPAPTPAAPAPATTAKTSEPKASPAPRPQSVVFPTCSADGWSHVRRRINDAITREKLSRLRSVEIDYRRDKKGVVTGSRSEAARKISVGGTQEARFDSIVARAFDGCRENSGPYSATVTIRL